MLDKIFIFIFLLLVAVFQISFFPNFFPEGSAPDLMLVVMIFFTARHGFKEAIGMTIVAGFLVDLLSFLPPGFTIFSFVASVFAVSFLARRFLVAHRAWKIPALVLMVAIGTLVNDITSAALFKFFLTASKTSIPSYFFWAKSLWLKMAGNIFLFFVVYWPLKKMENIKGVYGEKILLRNNVR